MSAVERFFDTNVLLYLLSADSAKADWVEHELSSGGTISVQVLNEFAAVALRRLAMELPDVREVLQTIVAACRTVPLTVQVHELGLRLIERYGFSVYDSFILAAALDSGCSLVYSEDLQDGQVIERALAIKNPFG